MTKNKLVVLFIIVVAGTTAIVSYRQFVHPNSSEESRAHVSQQSMYPLPPNPPDLVQSSPVKSSTSPSPASSAKPPSWAVYNNELYRYQIEYPSLGRLKVSGAGLDEHNLPQLQNTRMGFVQQFDPAVGDGQDEFGFGVTVYENPSNLTSQQWALKQWDEDVIRKQEAVTISGLPAYKLTIFEIDQTSDYIYLSTGNRVYKLSYWNPDSMFEFTPEVRQNYAAIFQRMVQSFKILQ